MHFWVVDNCQNLLTLFLVTGPPPGITVPPDCLFKRDHVAFSSWRCWRSNVKKLFIRPRNVFKPISVKMLSSRPITCKEKKQSQFHLCHFSRTWRSLQVFPGLAPVKRLRVFPRLFRLHVRFPRFAPVTGFSLTRHQLCFQLEFNDLFVVRERSV